MDAANEHLIHPTYLPFTPAQHHLLRVQKENVGLYNEGWLLRLILAAAKRGTPCLPFEFLPNSRWFSEAYFYSAFLPRHRGDRLSESWTHADGVVGQFLFDPRTKAGLSLTSTCTQFAVCEAKLFSLLDSKTKNAPRFDQAAWGGRRSRERARGCTDPESEA